MVTTTVMETTKQKKHHHEKHSYTMQVTLYLEHSVDYKARNTPRPVSELVGQ